MARAGRKVFPYRRLKALREIDDLGYLRRSLDGQPVRIDDWPWFEECRQAWAEAKARKYQFGWGDFLQFLEEMSAAAPSDGSLSHKFVMMDPDKGVRAQQRRVASVQVVPRRVTDRPSE